jgi:hypothetical protein
VPWKIDAYGHVFPSTPHAADGQPPRVLVDAAGVEWTIREVLTSQLWAKGQKCLVLDSHDCVRRLWQYPRFWRALDAAELFRLGVAD